MEHPILASIEYGSELRNDVTIQDAALIDGMEQKE
jgi:hypothetical protein